MYTIELFINDGDTPKWHRLNTEWKTKEEATTVANVLIEKVKDSKHDCVVHPNGFIHNTDFKVVGISHFVWGPDIVDIRLANVAPKIEIKKDSWHYKLTKLMTPKDSMPKSICGYFWNLVGRGLFSVLFIFLFGTLGGTVLINILSSFGITLGTGLTIGAYILGAFLFALLAALVFLIVACGVWLFADFLPRKMAQRRLKKRLEQQTNIQKDIEVREKSLSDEIHESFKNKHCNFIEFK